MNIYTNGVDQDTVINLFDNLEKSSMEKRINVLTQENDILIENINLLKDKYNEAERLIKNRSNNFDATYNQMIEDQTSLKDLQKGNIEQKREYRNAKHLSSTHHMLSALHNFSLRRDPMTSNSG